MTSLKVKNLHKSFADTQALRGVTFDVEEAEIVAILGPSGCGKSTILAIIAGLIEPDEGVLIWNGKPLKGIPSHKRGFGLMFQDFVLFPHLDVRENVAFGLKMSGFNQKQIDQRVAQMLDLVGLPKFGKRDVTTLSGGEQQRIALARSLAPKPRLLMLDEPLGSLDRNLRERLMFELRDILQEMKQTAIYVTHDQEEAFAVSDRVVVMEIGEVAQIGTPQDIYQHPNSVFVARFLGLHNLLEGQVQRQGDQTVINTSIGSLPVTDEVQGQVTVLIRPDAMQLDENLQHSVEGTIIERSYRGNICRIVVNINNEELTFDFQPYRVHIPSPGEKIRLTFDPEDAIQILTA